MKSLQFVFSGVEFVNNLYGGKKKLRNIDVLTEDKHHKYDDRIN